MGPVIRMDVAEFRREGYLQELNRCFLHPLGLALEVVVEDDGTERFGGIWDCREAIEGIEFADPGPDADLAANIDRIRDRRRTERERVLGYYLQPVASRNDEAVGQEGE